MGSLAKQAGTWLIGHTGTALAQAGDNSPNSYLGSVVNAYRDNSQNNNTTETYTRDLFSRATTQAMTRHQNDLADA